MAETAVISYQRHTETLSSEMNALKELNLSFEDHNGAKLKGVTLYKSITFQTGQLIHLKQRNEN